MKIDWNQEPPYNDYEHTSRHVFEFADGYICVKRGYDNALDFISGCNEKGHIFTMGYDNGSDEFIWKESQEYLTLLTLCKKFTQCQFFIFTLCKFCVQ